MGKYNVEGMLSPYRVLDLTDEKGLLCGKLLGDLGADVIKVERPGGDPARKIGPFYHDEVDPEKSLFWFAFNTNKRGITLDIETVDGKEKFKRLVKDADFVIESFPPGYMDKLGLGYIDLEKINTRIIMISITPFGQTGPYKDYKAPDIVAWAMGGQMYPYGDPDRPPIRISHHSHAYMHAAGDAAVGAMIALYYLQITGEGQHVDVSIQDSVVQTCFMGTASWDMTKSNLRRGHMYQNIRVKRMWPCKDGYVAWMYRSGIRASRFNPPFIKWMDDEGMADDLLKSIDWNTFDLRNVTQNVVDSIEETTAKFFMAHTKKELYEGAFKYGTTLYPVANVKDTLENTQLAARNFWVELEHPELGTSVVYPGAFAKTSGPILSVSHRSPLIGEHNDEIDREVLGLSKEVVRGLEQTKGFPASLLEESNEVLYKKPLKGIRVVDLTWAVAGPLTTKPLSDCGAEVIKIEGVTKFDIHRSTAPLKDGIMGINRGGMFNQDSTGKLSLTLNLSYPKAVEIVKQLVAQADIVVENFAGGSAKKMGLGYEQLKKVKPDIIMLSSCMQGQTGPYATSKGYGDPLTALAGFSHITGWPDREPIGLGVYTDYIAPHFNTFLILAAIDYRRRTGKGQYIDVSQYECGIHFMAPLILDYVVNHRVAGRMGNRYAHAAPHNAYRCHGDDRWCAIAIFTDEEWKSFCKVIGNPAWTNDLKFSTLLARKEHEEELDKLIEQWTVVNSAEEVMRMLQAAGVAAGVLQTGEDLLEHDPQIKHRHLFWQVNHPEIGNYYCRRPAFILSKSPYEMRRAPLLGEHTEYILKESLNMSDEEIAQLVIEGIIE